MTCFTELGIGKCLAKEGSDSTLFLTRAVIRTSILPVSPTPRAKSCCSDQILRTGSYWIPSQNQEISKVQPFSTAQNRQIRKGFWSTFQHTWKKACNPGKRHWLRTGLPATSTTQPAKQSINHSTATAFQGALILSGLLTSKRWKTSAAEERVCACRASSRELSRDMHPWQNHAKSIKLSLPFHPDG